MILSAGRPGSPLASVAHPKTSVPRGKSMKKLHYEELTQKEEKILNYDKDPEKGKPLDSQSYIFEFVRFDLIFVCENEKEPQKKAGISYKCLRYPLPPHQITYHQSILMTCPPFFHTQIQSLKQTLK